MSLPERHRMWDRQNVVSHGTMGICQWLLAKRWRWRHNGRKVERTSASLPWPFPPFRKQRLLIPVALKVQKSLGHIATGCGWLIIIYLGSNSNLKWTRFLIRNKDFSSSSSLSGSSLLLQFTLSMRYHKGAEVQCRTFWEYQIKLDLRSRCTQFNENYLDCIDWTNVVIVLN